MIKIKILLNSDCKPIVVLYIDGEFQTVYGEGKSYRSVEQCIEKVRDICSVIPCQHIEITKEALEKSSWLNGISIT